MAERITITMKDGTVEDFRQQGRPGGGYTIGVRYEGSFAVVTDEWHNETAFPVGDIAKVEVHQPPGRW